MIKAPNAYRLRVWNHVYISEDFLMYCKNCGSALNENQEICLACGVATGHGNQYCPNCGNPISAEAAFCMNCGAKLHQAAPTNTNDTAPRINPEACRTIEKRDIIKAIIFSILTCGIYSIYWFIVLTDEVNRISGHENDMSGARAFVLTLVTCGIYAYFWAYMMGKKVDEISGAKNSYTAIVYLILELFGLNIVTLALMQDSVNTALDQQ